MVGMQNCNVLTVIVSKLRRGRTEEHAKTIMLLSLIETTEYLSVFRTNIDSCLRLILS